MTSQIENLHLDERISRIVQKLLRAERADQWMDADGGAEHLRMSRHHFLRLCRAHEGPEGRGHGRLKRWRRSAVDAWQEGRGHA